MDRLTGRADGKAFLLACITGECNDDPVEICGDCEAQQAAFNKLADYEEAEEAGLLLRLPCKVGDTIYIIESNLYACTLCKHKAESRYNETLSFFLCDQRGGKECPEYIQEHIVEGFKISAEGCSAPGYWGYEGFETFSSVDDRWYTTRKEAEAALAERG